MSAAVASGGPSVSEYTRVRDKIEASRKTTLRCETPYTQRQRASACRQLDTRSCPPPVRLCAVLVVHTPYAARAPTRICKGYTWCEPVSYRTRIEYCSGSWLVTRVHSSGR